MCVCNVCSDWQIDNLTVPETDKLDGAATRAQTLAGESARKTFESLR